MKRALYLTLTRWSSLLLLCCISPWLAAQPDCDYDFLMGGTILPTNQIEICIDGIPDPIDLGLDWQMGTFQAWVITDEAGEILALPAGPPFDFDGAGPGVCQIWSVSYEPGLTGLAVGNNLFSDLDGCFELSENAITVNRYEPIGGQLTTADGATEISICAGDGFPDAFDVTLTGNSGPASAWIITDDQLNILALPDAPPFDLEGAGGGVCLVWHLSYVPGLYDLAVGFNAGDFSGCFDLSNPITVNRLTGEDCEILCNVDGGEIALADGGTEIEICAGDGQSDAFDVTLSGAEGENSAWVITDDQLNILALPGGPPFDLEGAGDGTCLVWHLSFDFIAGAEVGANAADLTGCFDLSNPITVIRNGVDGGEIALADGGTEIEICAGDGQSDAFDVTLTGAMGGNSAWVITDTALNILALPAGPPFDLEGAGPGVCLVWHLSFEDGLTGAEVGANAADLMGCFDLSNPITVIRNAVDGGEIALADGGTEIEICAGDGQSDAFDVTLTGNVGSNFAWVITDDSLNILALPAGPPFDLDGAGPGTCLVWHLSFEDGLTGAEVGANAADLMGCFDLSNPITVVRNQPDGGEIALTDGGDTIEICAGDGQSDAFDVTLTGNVGSNFAWVITDTALNILALPAGPPFDLEGAGPGVCLVWHLSFEDGLTGAEVGANAADLMGCFDLSNPITVIRNAVDGGEIALADGGTEIEICAGDGQSDAFDVTLTGNVGSNFAWVITDDSLNILALPAGPPFDLDGAGPGTCLVWHLSFEDGLTGAEVGANAADLMGCFDLSNPITVVRNQPDGGEIALADGGDTIEICAGDGQSDAFDVTLTGNVGSNFAWVITDTALNILALPAGPPFDLDGAGPGVCLVWHLSFEDGLTGAEVGANAADLMGCFDLSNPITVVRNQPDGGEIVLADGGTEIEICAGDGQSDAFDVTLTGNVGSNFAWVITDDSLNILALPAGPPFDLDGAGPGTCLVWHLSFEDGLTGAEVGANAADLMGCFDLSNPITVVRNQPDGGEIALADGGDEIFICAGDGQSDAFDVTLTGATGGNSAWVITDDELNILALPAGPPFDLEGAGDGICLIWHLSFEDGLTGAEVGANAADLMGCFDLSDSIVVFRDGVDGGEIALAGGGDTIEICAGDGESDAFDVTLEGTVGPNSAWVITDDSLNILALPAGPPFDLEGAGTGTCLVWHLSFYEVTGAEVGANAADLMGCFDLSNPITVIRNDGDNFGGELMLADGGTETTICADDGDPDPFDVTVTGAIGDSAAWIITDTLFNILALPEGPPFDLEGSGAGVCLLWYVTYSTIDGLAVDSNAAELTGCFSLSNFITVERLTGGDCPGSICQTEGGTIAYASGSETETTCTDETFLSLQPSGVATSQDYYIVLTDEADLITEWYASEPSEETMDIELSPGEPGLYRVYGWSTDGKTDPVVGANVGTLTESGCGDLSDNFLLLERTDGIACVTATNDPPAADRFRLYPNPVRDQLIVEIEGLRAERSELQIWDTNGRLVGRRYVDAGTTRWELPTTDLATGTYWLRLINRHGVSSRTFVKLR